MKSLIHKGLAAAGLLLFSVSASQAQVLYNANGWEASGSPAWTIGAILGQNNWTLYSDQDGDPAAPNFHRVVGTTTIGSQTITPKSGSRMHHNVSQNYAAVWTYVDLLPAFTGRTAGNNTVVVSSDIFLPVWIPIRTIFTVLMRTIRVFFSWVTSVSTIIFLNLAGSRLFCWPGPIPQLRGSTPHLTGTT